MFPMGAINRTTFLGLLFLYFSLLIHEKISPTPFLSTKFLYIQVIYNKYKFTLIFI